VQANPEFLSPGREDERARDLVEDHAQELCDTHAVLFSMLGTNASAAGVPALRIPLSVSHRLLYEVGRCRS
jgi:hypothetical protein